MTPFYNFLLVSLLSLSFISTTAQTFTTYLETDGLCNDHVNALSVSDDDVVWFATQGGICQFDGDNWISYTTEDGLVNDVVFAILADSEGNTWAGTDTGISMLSEGGTWTTYTTDDGLEDNRIKHLFESSNGTIWVGHNDGASSFDGTTFVNYTTADGLPFGGVSHVNEDNNGNIWFTTPIGGAFVLQDGNLTQFSEDEGLASQNTRSITIDANNSKWIASNEGISVFNDSNEFQEEHLDIFTLPPPHTVNPVTDVKIDSEGRIWAGLYVDYLLTVGGVSFYSNGVWIDYDEEDGLAGPAVNQLAIDSEDNIWVATTTGVTKIGDVVSSIDMISLETRTTLYPNPAHGTIHFTGAAHYQEVSIKDALGREILNLTQDQLSKGTIDITAFSPGMYYFQSPFEVLRFVVK